MGTATLDLSYTFKGWEQRQNKRLALLDFSGTISSKPAQGAAMTGRTDVDTNEQEPERTEPLFATDERLETEAAADVADLHAHAVLGESGDAAEREPGFVRVLAREPHIELVVERVEARDDSATFHRHHAVAVLAEGFGDNVRGVAWNVDGGWVAQ
jgi:hypothetical protein